MNSASIITSAVRLASIVRRCVDQRPRLATKHNKSPGQAWGISNPAGLVRRFVQVSRLDFTRIAVQSCEALDNHFETQSGML